jgi:DNA-binding MarR family transcriptional regulator
MPSGDEDPQIAAEIALAMTRLRARLRRESTPSAAGWSMAQVTVLARVMDEGPMTATDIAKAEHVRQQSAAEMVAQLKAGGLVEASRDPSDRRKSLITVTDAGRALVSSVSQSREAWLSRALTALLDEEDKLVLRRAAELLRDIAAADLDAVGAGDLPGA